MDIVKLDFLHMTSSNTLQHIDTIILKRKLFDAVFYKELFLPLPIPVFTHTNGEEGLPYCNSSTIQESSYMQLFAFTILVLYVII